MPRRKPITLTNDQIKQLEKLADYGLNLEMIADFFGMSRRDMFRLRDRDEKVGMAWRRGIAKGAEVAAKCLRAKILKGDTACTIFFCKVRLGMKEVDAHEVTVKHDVQAEMKLLQRLSPDQLLQIAEWIAAAPSPEASEQP